MPNRSNRTLIARVALALMLFAQAAMAWSACELPERAPERALRAAFEHAGCDEMANAQSGVSSVCFAHCLAGKQALYKAVLDIPPMPSAPVLIFVPLAGAISGTESVHGVVPAAGTGPPRRILLQSFQI